MRYLFQKPSGKLFAVAAPDIRTELLRDLLDQIQATAPNDLVRYQQEVLEEINDFKENARAREKRMETDFYYRINYPYANIQANQIQWTYLEQKYQSVRQAQFQDFYWHRLQELLEETIAWAPKQIILDVSHIPRGYTAKEIVATYRQMGLSFFNNNPVVKEVYDEWSEWAMLKIYFSQLEYFSKHYPLLYANSTAFSTNIAVAN